MTDQAAKISVEPISQTGWEVWGPDCSLGRILGLDSSHFGPFDSVSPDVSGNTNYGSGHDIYFSLERMWFRGKIGNVRLLSDDNRSNTKFESSYRPLDQ